MMTMTKPSQLLTLLATLLLLSESLSSADAAAPSGGNVDFMCINLQGFYIPYAMCQDVFQRDPRSPTATLPELGVIVIDIVSANATSIQNKIAVLLKGASPSSKPPLQACAKHYSDGVVVLQQARDYAADKNFAGSSDALQKYASYPAGCIEEYIGKKGIDNPVGAESDKLVTLSFIAKDANVIVGGNL